MTRLNKIAVTYLIVDEYNKQTGRTIVPVLLIRYVMRKTGVSRDKAQDYITQLINGINIEHKKYQIELNNGGYQCRIRK